MRRYTRHELNNMEIPTLKAICREAKIKPESMSVFQDKNAMVQLIYKYCGTVSDPYISVWDDDKIYRFKKAVADMGNEQTVIRTDVPAYIDVYKGIDSLNEKGSEYKIHSDAALGMTSALLIDRLGDIHGIVDISPETAKHTYLLTLRGHMLNSQLASGIHKDFSMIFFPRDFEKVARAYYSPNSAFPRFDYIKKPIQEIRVHEIGETDDVLVVDYGTSYTTVGVYTNGETKLTRFFSDEPCEYAPDTPARYANCQNCGRCALCPSVVAVKECKDGQVELLFGHEARDRAPMARNSIFFDTKRWVLNYEDTILVKDLEGNTAPIMRSEIVEKFLRHIIGVTEQQNKARYKKICFTSPVKQRALSVNMYREVLQDYEIVGKDAIDEAVAVIYDSIAQQVERLEIIDGEEKSVLLIDCGGSTSDMVRCDYTIFNQDKYSDLDIVVGYANGDTNFGGNNLTYRIMQYLKIKLARHYNKEQMPYIDNLLDVSYLDIYDFVDTHGSKRLFGRFDEAYQEAGETIPTNFDAYTNDAEAVYLNVKGNFYYLWNLAEQIKVDLYDNIGSYEFSFDRLKAAKNIYMLSVRNQKGMLMTHMEYPPIRISRDEINLLLKPEIYSLLKKFIEPYYVADRTMGDITDIKLSGQTTKIDIFRDVLKEYIAGHKVRAPLERSYLKKLKCIRGAIAYQNAKAIGRIRPRIKFYSAIVPYQLTVEAFNEKREIILIAQGDSLEDIYNYVDRTIETQTVIFSLKDSDMEMLQTIKVRLRTDSYRQTDYGTLLGQYKKLMQGDVDRIEEDEVRLFIYSDDESWGFKWIGIARRGGKLFCGEDQFVPFESAEWEIDFFDGKR